MPEIVQVWSDSVGSRSSIVPDITDEGLEHQIELAQQRFIRLGRMESLLPETTAQFPPAQQQTIEHRRVAISRAHDITFSDVEYLAGVQRRRSSIPQPARIR